LSKDRLHNHNHIYDTLDVSNKNNCEHIFAKYIPDVIVNTAAITNVDYCEDNKNRCLEVNAKSINHFIPFCKQNNVKLIHISTDFLFDGISGPYSEEEKYNPINYYGYSKMMAEENILNSKISNFSIIRTCLVYGEKKDSDNILMWVRRKLYAGEKLNIVDDQYRTPTFVDDLSQSIYKIIKKDIKGVYNISGGEFLSIFEFVCNIAKGLNQSLICKSRSEDINQKAKRPIKSGLLIDKAKKDFGFSPTQIKNSLNTIK